MGTSETPAAPAVGQPATGYPSHPPPQQGQPPPQQGQPPPQYGQPPPQYGQPPPQYGQPPPQYGQPPPQYGQPPPQYGQPPPPQYGQHQGYVPKLNPQPIPGVPIGPPLVPPQPGQVIVGYQMIQHESGCCKIEGMKVEGLVAIIVLVIVFWPVAFIPCLMDDCFQSKQVPVYDYPNRA